MREFIVPESEQFRLLAQPSHSTGRHHVSLMHPALPKQLRSGLAYAPVLHQPWTSPLLNASHPGTPMPARCWQRCRAGLFSERLCQPYLFWSGDAQLHTYSSDLFQGMSVGRLLLSPLAPAPTKAADAAPPAAAAGPDPAVMPSAAGSSWLSLQRLCSSFMAGMKGTFCKWYMLSLPQRYLPGKYIPQHVGVLHRDTQSPKLNIIQRSEEREMSTSSYVWWAGAGSQRPRTG